MKTRNLFTFIFFCLIAIMNANGQEDLRIKDILTNPAAFKGEIVSVTGLVTQYIDATEKTTAYFLLKDDYGAIIKVNTAEPKPETNTKYTVSGIVYFDDMLQMPFISEKTRIEIKEETTTIVLPPDKTWLEENLLPVIIGGSALLLLILITILIRRRKQPESSKTGTDEFKQPQPSYEKGIPSQRENLKTMVIPLNSPKTMKFIPGELEVITGEDKGKVFKISGFPTEEGSTVTVGRDSVAGPRDFAHIQLKERTISRRQAEIIYKDGKLFIRNLSETNYTKLDGKDIAPNSALELQAGSIITFGEIQMKYNV